MIGSTCDHCGAHHGKVGRFCTDRCRAAWHRTHDPVCAVRSCRRLKNGGVAITIHFADSEAERALHFAIGQMCVLGSITEDRK